MPRKILHIDDEPAIAAALLVRLRAAGFDVASASDGPSGLDAAARERPDAILLDIRMPGMDGYEVCRRLKADAELSDIPVIFLTANAKDEARLEARNAGGDGFLSKPYEAQDVISGLVKAAVFGFLVTLMGCYHGYNSRGGAQGVGAATTNAVVSSSILILSFNYFITELFFAR